MIIFTTTIAYMTLVAVVIDVIGSGSTAWAPLGATSSLIFVCVSLVGFSRYYAPAVRNVDTLARNQ